MDTDISVLIGKYAAKEAATNSGEARILVERSDLTGVTPKEADIIIQSSQQWQVVVIEDNPAESHWAFIVKRLQQ